MSVVTKMRILKREGEEGRRRDGEREQAAEHRSQKERELWDCSQGYRAKPGSVERQCKGGAQRQREREQEKEKGEVGQCKYIQYE